jgi:hypothetical protein
VKAHIVELSGWARVRKRRSRERSDLMKREERENSEVLSFQRYSSKREVRKRSGRDAAMYRKASHGSRTFPGRDSASWTSNNREAQNILDS